MLKTKLQSAASAVQGIRSGDAVYIHSNAAAPHTLIEAMVARKGELKAVKLYKIITLGPAPYADADCEGSFYVHSLFIGPNVRQAVNEGRADYTPVFFSDLPQLMASGKIKIDVCILSCSPPDDDGYMTLGVSLDSTLGALKNARLIIVELNKQMPRTHGENKIHVNDVHAIVETDRDLPVLHNEESGEVDLAIGKNVASLVQDGATIQMGIGAIPNSVLACLHDKKDLGIHSEMFSDGVLELVEKGVVTNQRKTLLPGKMVVSFVMGSRRLYDFLDNNQTVEFRPSDWVNDPAIISQNYRMTAINAAIQADLSGQICADSLGTFMYSGCGGQVDFVRGASRAHEGRAIIALPSTARNGTISRIVPMLNPGAGVVTSRADMHYLVTEFGIVDLHGMNMRQRAQSIIELAHPKFRDWLWQESRVYGWLAKLH